MDTSFSKLGTDGGYIHGVSCISNSCTYIHMKLDHIVTSLFLTQLAQGATIDNANEKNKLEVSDNEDLLSVVKLLRRDGGDAISEEENESDSIELLRRDEGSSYGKDLPDYSDGDNPPPPYLHGSYGGGKPARDGNPPGPYYATSSYGMRGSTPSYWNGQYYPYRRFGYGRDFLPDIPPAQHPEFFVGPFGFYGPYAKHRNNQWGDNAVVDNIYVRGNGSNSSSSGGNTTDLSDGMYFYLEWQNSIYSVHSVSGGTYEGGVLVGNNTYVNGTFRNGTDSSKVRTHVTTINPNKTSNGTDLRQDRANQDGSGKVDTFTSDDASGRSTNSDSSDSSSNSNSSSESSGADNAGASVVAPGILFMGTLLLL